MSWALGFDILVQYNVLTELRDGQGYGVKLGEGPDEGGRRGR